MDEEEVSFIKTLKFKILISWLVIFTLVGLSGALYFTLKSNKKEPPKQMDKEIENLTVGLSDDYTSPDIGPTKNYDQSSHIFRNFYDSLVSYSEDGRLMPDLATSWTNPDELTWRFILRKGVKFSDGKDFSAYDVKYTFDAIKNDSDSQLNEYFQEITEVNPVGQNEVEIKTAKPVPYLISKLSFLLIVPNGSKDITLANTPGTGPFVYNKQEVMQGKQLVMDRNENYWGADKPKVKKITAFIYLDDENQKVQDFKDGKTQIVDAYDKEIVESLKGVSSAKNLSVNENSVAYLVLNNDENADKYFSVSPNPLKDKRVRLAMWEALDTNGMVNETLKNIAIPADQVVAKQTFGFNPAIKRPEFDLADAKKLMADSGHENGFQAKLLIAESRKEVGEYVKKAWNELGIDVEIVDVPKTSYVETFMSHDFGVGFISWAEDSKDGQNTLMTLFGDSDQNMGSFKDKTLEDLMQKLSAETNQRNRQKLIQEGLKIIREEVPVIPLYSMKINWFISPNVSWQPPETLDLYYKNAKGVVLEKKKETILSKLKFW